MVDSASVVSVKRCDSDVIQSISGELQFQWTSLKIFCIMVSLLNRFSKKKVSVFGVRRNTGFMSLRLNCLEITQVTQKC